MKKNKKSNNTNITRITQIDKIIIICLILMLVCIPLTMRLHIIKFISPTITDLQALQSGDKYEIYTSFKFYLLLAFTSIISILFFIKIFVYKYEIKKTKMNIFLIIFILILLLSTLLSPFKYIALFGFYNRHEGVLTYLCYSFIIFIVTNIELNKKTILYFFYALTPFILINSALSILSFYGYGLLKFNFVQKLIYSNMTDRLSITDSGKLEGTLYNIDFMSGMSALLFYLFFILSIFEKRMYLKIINIILFLCSVGILLSTLASSGFITVILLLPIIFIILLLKKEYKKVILGISLLIVCSFIFVPFQHHDKRVWNGTFGNFIHTTPVTRVTEKPTIRSTSNTNDIGKPINHSPTKAIAVVKKPINHSTMKAKDTSTSDFELPKLPEKGEAWGSGRGYIWVNTIPLLLEKPFLGYGLDTFPYEFPQMGPKIISGLGQLEVVGKPHSLYLGIAYGTGILGLIIFLFMLGIPLLKVTISMIKSNTSNLNYEMLAILFVLLAYLIQGLVNDSNIGTDLIFYTFLGLLSSIQLNKESVS